MIVIVVPGLRADDLTRPELSTLRRIVSQGAIGWMNTRTARVPGQQRDPIEATYLTLGAGSRATAGSYARVITSSTLVRLKAENAKLDHPVHIGALGDMLHAAGLKTQVLGNEDDLAPRRAAVMMAMDSKGQVDTDKTDMFMTASYDPLAPFGITDKFVHLSLQDDPFHFIVWVIGDVARSDRYAPFCLPKVAEQHRQKALRRVDLFLRQNIVRVDSSGKLYGYSPSTCFLLLSPAPAVSAAPGDRLAPLLMFGNGIQPGLLTSASTKLHGLVTNTDFLPTVAAYFGLKPPKGMIGRPITVAPIATNLPRGNSQLSRFGREDHTSLPTPELWASLHDWWMARASQQAVLGGLPTLQLAIALLVIAIGWRRRVGAWYHLADRLPLVIVCLPIALLILPLLAPPSVLGAALTLAIALLSVLIFALRWPDLAVKIATVALGALIIGVALDLTTGGMLLRNAWMSYNIMEGARYYGIGNEYSAAVFAGALLCAQLLLHKTQGRALFVVLVGLTILALLIGLPWFGANAGGCMAAMMGYGMAGWVWIRGRWQVRDIFCVLAIVCLIALLVFSIDFMGGAQHQSHIARAMTSGEEFGNIVWRKLTLNLYLLLHSPWSLCLFVSAAGWWHLIRYRISTLKQPITQERIVNGTVMGTIFGITTLLIFNDSGVVAAAEAMLLFWAFIYLDTDRMVT